MIHYPTRSKFIACKVSYLKIEQLVIRCLSKSRKSFNQKKKKNAGHEFLRNRVSRVDLSFLDVNKTNVPLIILIYRNTLDERFRDLGSIRFIVTPRKKKIVRSRFASCISCVHGISLVLLMYYFYNCDFDCQIVLWQYRFRIWETTNINHECGNLYEECQSREIPSRITDQSLLHSGNSIQRDIRCLQLSPQLTV